MEIILGALAEAIFELLISDLAQRPKLQSLRDKLRGDSPEKLALQRAIATAYLRFTQKFHDLSSSLFDEILLQNPIVVSEITKLLTPNQTPDHTKIAEAWRSQFSFPPSIDLENPINFFLTNLQTNIKYEPLLKPFVDSRAFEQLYTIAESSISQTRLQSETNDILENIRELLSHTYNDANVHFSGGSFSPTPTIPLNKSNLPNKHPNFVGRIDELKEVVAALSSRAWIVSIDGIGGVGKQH